MVGLIFSAGQKIYQKGSIDFTFIYVLYYSLKHLAKIEVLTMTVSRLIDVGCFIFKVGDLKQKEVN